MDWDTILAFFVSLWGAWQVKFLLGHILINVVVAVAASIYTNEFFLGKTGEFLYHKVLPFLLVYIAAFGVGEAAGMSWLATAVWALLELNLIGDLTDNLSKLGVPMPGALEKKDEQVIVVGVDVTKGPEAKPECDGPDADEALALATEAAGIPALDTPDPNGLGRTR